MCNQIKKVMKNKLNLSEMFTTEVDVSKENLRSKVKFGKMALQRLNLVKGKVSVDLYKMLVDSLAGFSKEMQQEMAACIVDFYYFKVMTFTGCFFVDVALLQCYFWIGVELHIVTPEVMN